MPQEHKSHRDVLNAIQGLPSLRDLLSQHDGRFDRELDIEVTVYGRNYNGKKVGPYFRLLTYDPGEAIINEGEWGGNTFFIVVGGRVEVFVDSPAQHGAKISELGPGAQFGIMSVLAGTPRKATVRASRSAPAQVIEIQRPALRLLRKSRGFGESIDGAYRSHGRDALIEDLRSVLKLDLERTKELSSIAYFRLLSKNHSLFCEDKPMDRIYIIKEGWVCRTQQSTGLEDFLGNGFCFGIEGLIRNESWGCSGTIMGRTEVLEIPISKLRQNVVLREAVFQELTRFTPPFVGASFESEPNKRDATLAAQRRLIATGLVDGTKLFVMDMDLCIRCGNCSMACHKVHGQSRIQRRGIHVTRLKRTKPPSIQSLLSPTVCMHCQAPECLTGCPTDAISRFADGHIDVNPGTCIGCGDCAAQCPYNAISMVPRKGIQAKTEVPGGSRVRDFFKLADPLPSAVESDDNLVAVMCNLCSDRTTLNPAGSSTQAYSCEENCPTGALTCINPREYFTEIGDIEGLLFLDKSHATGRNIHRSDPLRTALHLAGLAVILLSTGAIAIGMRNRGLDERSVGPLSMRLLTALIGLVAVVGAMAYPARRLIYKNRAGPLRYWLISHYYLAALATIVFLAHGGIRQGSALTTSLRLAFDLVILTGLFGLFAYLVVPRLLTRIEGSPLLLEDLKARRRELEEEIVEIAGSAGEPLRTIVKDKVVPRFASTGFLVRQYLKRDDLATVLKSAAAEFDLVTPELEDEKDRLSLKRAAEAAATMRRLDALIYLHGLLKIWLPPHLVITYAMLALMLGHVVQVLYRFF